MPKTCFRFLKKGIDKTARRLYNAGMEQEEKIIKLGEMLKNARHAVFFGGAGVSTASGLPDFRSPDGLAAKKYKWPFEVMLSYEFFFAHTAEFYDYYFRELDLPDIKPNAAHLSLARLESEGKIKAVITQNIDGLHQAAGSRNVIELHGTVSSAHCVRCGKAFGHEEVKRRAPLPKCECGGIIKPDVVLYGESLDGVAISRALDELEKADLVIVGGTSLAVYPAAGFLRETSGRIAVINKEAVAEDRADIVILGNIAEIMPYILRTANAFYIAHR